MVYRVATFPLPAPYINYFGASHPMEQHEGEEEEYVRNVLETY
jgi:hypothetical protein